MTTYTYAGQYGPEALLDTSGDLLPTIAVAVYETDGTTLATIYTSRTKSATAVNPTTTDARGDLTFFADPGNYVIGAGTGGTLPVMVPVDPAELSATYAPKTVGVATDVGNGGHLPTPLEISYNDGSPAAPNTTETYVTPVVYIERHTDSVVPTGIASWGNARKTSALLVEVVGYANETGEVNGIATRVQSTGAPGTGQAGNVAISAQAQSATAAGVQNRDCWGANLCVVVSGSGTAPGMLVGAEVDLSAEIAMTSSARAGQSGAQKYVGLMVQSASNPCNAGLWVTSFDGSANGAGPGWLNGVHAEAWFSQYAGYFRNTKNASGAGGLLVQNAYANVDTNVLSVLTAASTQLLKVTGDTNNPVSMRMGGSLYAMWQQATTGTTSGFTAGSGTAMNSASTSTGGQGTKAYTFGDVVLALKQLGFLASS